MQKTVFVIVATREDGSAVPLSEFSGKVYANRESAFSECELLNEDAFVREVNIGFNVEEKDFVETVKDSRINLPDVETVTRARAKRKDMQMEISRLEKMGLPTGTN